MGIKLIKRNIYIWLILVFAVLLFAGCSVSETKNEKLNWNITAIESRLSEKMEAVDNVRQYDGSIAKVAHSNNPGTGNVYVLVNLDLKKNVSGNHPFVWANLVLKDAKGKEHKRIQDVFLADYKLSRLSATDLKLDGKGWICFEVPKDSTSKMELIYSEAEKKNIIKLNK